MVPSKPTLLDLVTRVRERSAGSSLSQAQAKLYSQHTRLGLRRPGLTGFSKTADVEARLEEAWLLLDAAIAEREEAADGQWRKGVKRAGELLEWLSHAEMGATDVPASVLAAAAYQIAGYPAMANGLLAPLPDSPGTERILHLFLSGSFPDVLLEASAALTATDPYSRADPESESHINRVIIEETLRCFLVLASHMRWGDEERLEPALEKLTKLAALARHSQVRYSAICAHLCALAAREYASSALWPHLRLLGQGESDPTRRAIERFGRVAFLSSRSLAWPSQVAGIKRLSLKESFVLCTPTGSGKTAVAELGLVTSLFGAPPDAALQSLADFAPLALYLVPSRALAAEIEGRLDSDLRTIGEGRVRVTGLYGGTDWGPTDAWLTSDSPTVLVCTYEKAEALLRFLGPLFIQRVKCVIVDEAHFVQFGGTDAEVRTFESRALKLESLGARLLRSLDGRTYRMIALSAVTAGLEGSISRWLVGESSEPAHSDHRSTRQLVGRLECFASGATRIQYDLLDRARLTFADDRESPFVPDPFPIHPPSPSLERGSSLAAMRPHLLWAALNLIAAGTSGPRHSVLISVMSHITTYAEDFLRLLEEDWADHELPVFFELPKDPEHLRLWTDCLATARDYFTEESPEYRLMNLGVAVHHGKMPALLARRLKVVIELGIARLVLATSTLSEGVNLPVEYILVPEVFRQPRNQLISPREFMNLVGRAGRPGHGTEGRTLVLVPQAMPGRKLGAIERVRRQGAENAINSIADRSAPATTTASSPLARLLELVLEGWSALAPNGSEREFLDWLENTAITAPRPGQSAAPTMECLDTLDGILIAGLEELRAIDEVDVDVGAPGVEDGLRRLWSHSFARVAADETSLIERAFLRRGSAIPILYPDIEERRRIYKTSLPPASARELLTRSPDIVAHLITGDSYASWSSVRRFEFVRHTVDIISGVSRFAPGLKAGRSLVDWRDVLRWWLDPTGSAKRPTPKQIGAWHEYAAKHFAYKANWALGSVLALSLDRIPEGALPVALTLDDWPNTGLPWIAFWMKELLTWGTLEPVAAFLLARGGAVTRPEAESESRRYYLAQGSEADARNLLDPRRIRAWADVGGRAATTQQSTTSVFAEVSVRLARPVTEFVLTRLRVLPHRRGDRDVLWTDSAGYEVARSTIESFQDHWLSDRTDFMLDTRRGTVSISEYL